MTSEHEDLLNGELARLLREHGIAAEPEVRERGRRMDVVADIDGVRVVLEAETGYPAKRRQAVREADARLRQGLTSLALAVCYPDGATVARLGEAGLAWALRTRPGAGADWREGGIDALADAVRRAPDAIGDADRAAQALSSALDGTVARLSRETRSAVARALDLPERGNGARTAAKRGLLVVATAMLFHHRVQGHLPRRRPDGWTEAWPPAAPAACAAHEAPAQAYRNAWRAILAVDYAPVFETAIAALVELPASPDMVQALRGLGERVEDIAGRTVGLRHDLLGRIFHRVLDTARYDGSFYTSTAAATLLAALAVREDDTDWGDADAIARLRVCDPACGTGTLLMAAYERMLALRRAATPPGGGDADAEQLLATYMIEEVLWGYDINLTATHMAASTLGMLSPRTQFSRINIHRTRLGRFEGQTYIGSLEFLAGEGGQPRLAAWPSISGQVDAPEAGTEPPPPMDLVIMNPPFTRDSLRHDQFTRAEEQAIKKREQDVLGQLGQAASLSGSANAFLVLGERLTERNGGTLGVVLPTVMATNPAARETRRFLASRFRIDTIVASHDPERIWFSENTKIGEILLVCRRGDDGEAAPARVVNLARNPATPEEALRLIDHLERGDESDWAVVRRVPAERLAEGDWYAVNFLSPWLADAFRELKASTVPLSEIAEVGPDGRVIRGNYRRSELPTASGRVALWRHRTGVTQSMGAHADSYIEPKDGKEHLADRYWEQRSRLLLPHRLRLNLTRVAAVTLGEPAMGSIWTPCRPADGDPATEAAICAWLNSSVGVLALLAERDARVPDYPSFSLDALRALRVPDFRERAEARDALAAAHARLKDATLAPFPQLAEDPVRRELDDASAAALGLDAEWVARVRTALAREPSVTGRRWEG